MKQLICNPIDLEWAEHMKPTFEEDAGRRLEIWVDKTCPPGSLFLPDTDIDTTGMRRPK